MQGCVDSLGVADVFQHDFALVQGGLAEPQLQQLQISNLFLCSPYQVGSRPYFSLDQNFRLKSISLCYNSNSLS